MDTNSYLSLDHLLGLINEPNQSCARRLLEENKEILETAPGSRSNHHAWPGGYLDHVRETMNLAVQFYQLNNLRPLPFSLSDAVVVMYLHDLEKPWKYCSSDSQIQLQLKEKEGRKQFREEKIKIYKFQLTSQHWNALEYVEGEHDYSPGERKQLPLAAFCHLCDSWSARGWYDYPQEKNSWKGAKRGK
ncbi:MAG: hypothetical protein Q7K45_02035 [Nanoarchaeota archaeon]|nr:hypothetical protein [Nanoarchaeota archaeon]